MKPMRVGVDTGGTFTDCVVQDAEGVRLIKVFSASPSSPEEASRALLGGVAQLVERQSAIDIVHGTTVSTNSLLERRGARVALITTHGFQDLIEIGRQARPRLYDLDVRRDPPLVDREMRWGVRERTAADGSVLLRPSARELETLRDKLTRSRAESVAVCLLFSFSNPANERLVARALRPFKIPLSVSHQILPEFREYERLSTTTINAYLMPRVGSYLSKLQQDANRELFFREKKKVGLTIQQAGKLQRGRSQRGVKVFVMESSGGITTARHAAREPVRTILSGPAGGVCAAARLASQLGIRHAISFDMGGTSTDVCLIEGSPRITNEATVGGLPVAVPVIDVHSVGAGGGSLARFDAGGALRVGPESAGATPGPSCYGRGGRRPTVTDAHLILGRIDPDYFLGGTFHLDPRAAERAFKALIRSRHVRRSTFRSTHHLARGIIAVSNASMERALRVISVERGHDPRDFALIAFGGAGGLHAADLARALGIARIVIPPNPGTFSALGMLLSDIIKDVSESVLMAIPKDAEPARSTLFRQCIGKLESRFHQLERSARAQLRKDQFPSGQIAVEKQLEVRYAGQSFGLTVPFSPRFPMDFEQLHTKTYGYSHGRKPLEVVNLRLRLTVPTTRSRPAKRFARARSQRIEGALVKEKDVWFEDRYYRTVLYSRNRLCAGMSFKGPVVVVEYSSTTVVPPDFACTVDRGLNLVLTYDEN